MAERVLVVLPRDLPGLAMCEPALRAIKLSLPRCHLTLCASKKLEPLVQLSHHADEVVIGNPSSPFFFLVPLHSKAYRAVLFKTTLGGTVGLRLAKVRKRVGFRKLGLSWMLNRGIRKMPAKFRHVRVRHLVETVRYFGCEVTDRIPQWHLEMNHAERDLLITHGIRGKLPTQSVAAWQEAGFDTVPPGTDVEALIKHLKSARRVVGPPDSAVTLARAMGLNCLRLRGRKPPLDDFPGAPSCVLPAATPPAEALEQWAQFNADNSPS